MGCQYSYGALINQIILDKFEEDRRVGHPEDCQRDLPGEQDNGYIEREQ